jgi:hypothetical protein
MIQPVSSGDTFQFDLIGWIITSIGIWVFTNFAHILENPLEIVYATTVFLVLIFIPIFLTVWFFSKLSIINSWRNQVIIVSGLLMAVGFINGISLLDFWGFQTTRSGSLFYISWLLINNLVFWMGAIILPTYFVYPEIRERNLRRVVALCFFLTAILRYGGEYLISFTPASGLSYVFHEAGVIYAGYNLAMIPVTIGFAFVSYWIIHELMQRVPRVKRLLGTVGS